MSIHKGEDWAFEGRRISRRAYEERDREQASDVSLPLEASSEEMRAHKFKRYINTFNLTDADLAEDKSICVIGAGDNAFAGGLAASRPDGKHAFVMGVDPAEKRYQQLSPAIINHDARALGFPSDFEGFDSVLSLHAVPKYFLLWHMAPHHRELFIDNASDIFDYDIADYDGSVEEVADATLEAFSEMLRITKPGGTIKMFPVEVAHVGRRTFAEVLVEAVVGKLKQEYPGIQMRYSSRNQISKGGILLPPSTEETEPMVLELTRPLGPGTSNPPDEM